MLLFYISIDDVFLSGILEYCGGKMYTRRQLMVVERKHSAFETIKTTTLKIKRHPYSCMCLYGPQLRKFKFTNGLFPPRALRAKIASIGKV